MEYKSFFKRASGGEGQRCYYPDRLDTYGCGCAHNCSYCYARSLLSFRGLWEPDNPRVADIEKVRRKVKKLEPGSVVRLVGMTDCFQPAEARERVTLETVKALNERRVHYLIVTKSPLVASPEYTSVYDPEPAHIQVTVTTTDDGLAPGYEAAPFPSARLKAASKLEGMGFDTAVRLSPYLPGNIDIDVIKAAGVSKHIVEFLRPYLPGNIDIDVIKAAGVSKHIVEFLRVNHWIEKWFDVPEGVYTVKHGGYGHMPLLDKVREVERIAKHLPGVSVCEDVPDHYDYWARQFNPNPNDCCNLRLGESE